MGPAAWLSIAAHGAVLVALLIAASWRIDKLSLADPTIYVSAGAGLPVIDPGEGAAPAKPSPSAVPKKRARRVRDLAQPEPAPAEPAEEREVVPVAEGRVEAPRGAGLFVAGSCPPGGECLPAGLAAIERAPLCGDGRVEPGEECDDGGRVNHDGCSARCKAERMVVVDPRVIEGHRVAGDPQIHPPPAVRDRMVEDRAKRVVGIVKMCLSPEGAVSALSIQRSTGYPIYDTLLLSRMSTWRYRPYRQADGTPVAACTKVAFIYRIEIQPIRREGLR